MIRHPPRSTLFPYPPLFRSRVDAGTAAASVGSPAAAATSAPAARALPGAEPRPAAPPAPPAPAARRETAGDTVRMPRSEEHTSELQSPCNLVCRLLLEKKKT